jgi:uncharacterized protein (TIGR00369 family)
MDINDISIEKDNSHFMQLATHFVNEIPHGIDLGLTVENAKHAEVVLRIPYQNLLLGDVDRGLIHGGVMTSIIDSASGLAAFCALPDMEAIATLDLRIDNMRPAVKGKDIYAWAKCYRMTSQIAFVRAVAYQERDLPLVTSSSAFMRSSSSKSFMKQGAGK